MGTTTWGGITKPFLASDLLEVPFGGSFWIVNVPSGLWIIMGLLTDLLEGTAGPADFGDGGSSAAMTAAALANGMAADSKAATKTPLNRLMKSLRYIAREVA
jgi:hypothetical protein